MTVHYLPVAVRNSDPATSRQTPSVTKRMNTTLEMLGVYCLHDVTDEEAIEVLLGRPATLADDSRRRRCSDLRALGWIAPTGDTRQNSTGRQRIVCAITEAGRDAWYEANK